MIQPKANRINGHLLRFSRGCASSWVAGAGHSISAGAGVLSALQHLCHTFSKQAAHIEPTEVNMQKSNDAPSGGRSAKIFNLLMLSDSV
mmetsp:Transcript_29907/g.56001  ORF Transcript_29907/g.56001 Transcript_29907/m.56001 type:complete len:89 (+) Transcript_29907:862-1128(+)